MSDAAEAPQTVEQAPAPEPTETQQTEDRIASTLKELGADGAAIEPEVESEDGEEEKPAKEPKEKKAKEETPPEPAPVDANEAALRKQQLILMRQERLARAASKRARNDVQIAQRLAQARNGWEQDPTKIPAALGIDPVTYYQRMTEYALRQGQPDPVQQQIQQQMNPLQQQLNRERQEFQQQRDQMMEYNAINNVVLPVVVAEQANGNYDAMMAYCDDSPQKAAKYVYDAIKEHYKLYGQTIPPKQAAEILNKHHERLLEEAIGKLKTRKAFQKHFVQPEPEKPKTLRARHNAVVTPRRPGDDGGEREVRRRPAIGDESIAETLALFENKR